MQGLCVMAYLNIVVLVFLLKKDLSTSSTTAHSKKLIEKMCFQGLSATVPLFVSLFQIVFEAIRGSSVRSDIGIDDIIVEGGPCPGKLFKIFVKHPRCC